MKVIIVGTGWGGISAAYQASKRADKVILIEKTDMILGTGLVGGIMGNNGRFTGIEEIKYMGNKDLIEIIDTCSRHRNIDFPGHKNANFYDIRLIEKAITDLLLEKDIKIIYETRISKVEMYNDIIKKVISDNDLSFNGDVFIDATGTAGPINNCIKYGNGCVMCVLRCPTFKGRISLTNLCGIEEMKNKSMSGSFKLIRNSLSNEVLFILESKGVFIVPLEKSIDNVDLKVCQQYNLDEYKNNLILLDTGEVKVMAPYYPLNKLRKIKRFENAKYLDPYSGGKGNSMRLFDISPRDNTLKVKGIDNLFCVGEKTNLIGHTEAIITGILAGYNATNKEKIELPLETVSGLAIDYSNGNIDNKYTLSGSVLFDKIKELDLYTTDKTKIKTRIKELELYNLFK